MKAFLVLVLIAAGAFLAYRFGYFYRDPVESMRERVSRFPTEVHSKDREAKLYDVAFNVKKTDSLNAPIVGIVSYAEESSYGADHQFELVFHWQKGEWYFQRSRAIRTSPYMSDLWDYHPLESPEIKSWIAHGRVDAAAVRKVIDEMEAPRREAEAAEAQAEAARQAQIAAGEAAAMRRVSPLEPLVRQKPNSTPRYVPTAAEEQQRILRQYGTR